MRLSEALLLLDAPDLTPLTPGARLKVCHQAYLAKARELHPDQHPENDQAPSQFQQLQAAWARVKAWLSTPHRCPSCDGKGLVPGASRFPVPAWVPCPTCQGHGWVTPVEDP